MTTDAMIHVVDDEGAVAEALRVVLESVGYTTRCYRSAAEFLAAAHTATCGCLVADYRMPGMNGLELLDELARRQCSLPAIMISGYGDVPSVVRAIKGGAVEFLEKPFRLDVLVEAIETALRHAELARQQRSRQAAKQSLLHTLTPKEVDVLKLMLEGKPDKTVARMLGISIRTVQHRRASAMAKCHATSRIELIRITEMLSANVDSLPVGP